MTDAAGWIARAHAVTDGATSGPWAAEHADRADWLTEAIAADGHAEDHEPVSLVRVQGVPRGGPVIAAPSWPFRNGHNDTEFIASSRTMLPAAVAAIEAVLALHRAMPPLSNPDPTLNCYTCDEPSPCDTVRAITAHLDPS